MCNCDSKMTSFRTFAKYAFSTLLVLVLMQEHFLQTSAAPVTWSTADIAARLFNPCGGSRSVEGVTDIPVLNVEAHELYLEMSTKALEVEGKVRALMNRYMDERFHSRTFEAETQHLKVDLLPTLEAFTPESAINLQALDEAHKAYHFLAVATMLLENARIEESLREGGAYNVHFNDIRESGTFWLMCQLHKVVAHHQGELQTDVINRATQMEISDSENTNTRRTIHFVVLRDLEKMLKRSVLVFQELKQVALASS